MNITLLLKLTEESAVAITCAVLGLLACAVEPMVQDYADERREERRRARKQAKKAAAR